MKYKALAIALVIATLSGCFGPGERAESPVYTAALQALPTHLDPWRNQINTSHFINIQVYYPLFRRTRDGELFSDFLDTKRTRATDQSFTEFEFCLKVGVKFSDDTPIQPEDLILLFRSAHATQESLPTILDSKIRNGCVRISLRAPDPSYFEKFTGVASTILKRATISDAAPIGLGPYKVESIGQKKVILVANKAIAAKSYFQRIEFHRVNDLNEAVQKKILDTNHVYAGRVPHSIKTTFKVVTKPTMKSYALVVSIPQASLRREFVACLNRSYFRKLVPFDLDDIPGFLPKGALGFDVDFSELTPKSACRFGSKKPIVTFFSFVPSMTDDLERFFKSESSRLPIQVRVQSVTLDETIKAAFSGASMISLVGFDSSGSISASTGEAAVYFESFFRPERLIREELKVVGTKVRSALETGARSALKSQLYREAHRALLESHYVVPIGQLQSKQYYPNYLDNIVWEDQIGGYPRIDLMTTNR